ncbi:MAG TPA: O-antigen ligase family protein [Pyrinomonadaceae bacterium]|jgi:O-antigen ligase|nr:O-antigen ligase family protein [Pyrinomonadaceae bacterium]
MSIPRTDAAQGSAATTSEAPARAFAVWLERATVACLFLFAFAAPHSIAAAQTAWLLGLLFWVLRFCFRPRPKTYRTPVDAWLLGFFVLTFLTALTSYDPDVSIGKLRAASLFTIVYLAAENVRSPKVLRALALTLVASCALGLVHTFGVFALGRGVKVRALAADSPLRAAGVEEGDTIESVDGAPVNRPEEVEHAIETERPSLDKVYRWPDGSKACGWDERVACVRVYRAEVIPAFNVARDALLRAGNTPEARLGILSWSRGRDERASGFYGQYQTYSEVLQLIASLALGLLVALRRKRSLKGALLAASLAGMCGALLLTLTRASWAGFLLSALTIMLVGASRRTLVVAACAALPVVLAGLFVLQQKRQVGFIDSRDQSTSWRLMVWREGFDILVSRPRHLLVGVGMDSLKRHWREWGMFDQGRQPWGHLHSTPLQIAFERGVPVLLVWMAWLFVYGRMLWRLARRGAVENWVERGLLFGALGGLVGFVAGGLVHYNFGDSEVVMVFYFVMGLALVVERFKRLPADAQEG